MKAFIRKLKRSNKIFLSLYIISVLAYIITYVLFTVNLLHLSTIETPIRIILIFTFGVYAIIWLLAGIVSIFAKKYKRFIILLVFTSLFSIIFGVASYYVSAVYSKIEAMNKDKLVYTSALVTLKNTEFDSKGIIGMINDTNDVEGYILGNKLIKSQSLTNEIKRYDDYLDMFSDLLNNKIMAIVVTNNYTVRFGNEDGLEDIGKLTKVVYTYSEEMQNTDNVSYTDKKLTEPFSLLLMGVDSENDGLNAATSFNGDTLMLITFNPNTLTASAFSIPRDTYVPIACRNNAWAKINSSAGSGTNCVIKTIKQLTDIDIDFYVKVNFRGVVDLVNALGGVTVDVQKPDFTYREGVDYHGKVCEQDSFRRFGDNMVCMDPGVQRLNGEQALAYSRSRKQFIGSDLDRVKHQQQVVSAIVNEVKNITTFEQFQNLLSTIERNMDTNMKSEQIMSLYNVAKKIVQVAQGSTGDVLSINKTYLETYNLPVWLGSSRTSALGYYKDSMDEISNMMKVNLGLADATLNKTFKIDYNENYKSRFYGEGLRGNGVEKLMTNLVGKTKDEALNWIEQNGKTASVTYIDETSEFYDASVCNGCVAYQDPHVDVLLNNISQVTIYVVDKKDSTKTNTDNNKKQDSSDKDKTKEDEPDNKDKDENKQEELPSEITPVEDKDKDKDNGNDDNNKDLSEN